MKSAIVLLTKKIVVYMAAMLLGLIAPITYASYITVIESPFGDVSGDYLDRGFYVENYGADNLAQVTLEYESLTTGTYDTSLTVRIDSYNGTIVGEAKFLSTYFEAHVPKQVVYDFGGINVPYGSLLTFTQNLINGPDSALFYDIGVEAHSQITQTNGTASPLDSWRRDRVGVVITAIPEPATLSLLALGAILVGRKRNL